MSVSALIVMILICGFVWGGFLWLLSRAIRKEGAKARERVDEQPPGPSS